MRGRALGAGHGRGGMSKDLEDRTKEGTRVSDPAKESARVRPVRAAQPGERQPGVQAERALLGAILWAGLYEPAATRARAVEHFVQPDTFLVAWHRGVYAAMVSLETSGALTEPVAVCSEARRLGHALDSRELDALVDEASAPTEAKLTQWAKEIREQWLRRRVGDESTKLATAARSGVADSATLCELAAAVVELAKQGAGEVGTVSLLEGIQSFAKSMNATRPDALRTGFDKLDDAIGGLFRKEVSVLAARTSVGKSALSSQISTHVAGGDVGVLYVSLEMSAESLSARVIATRAGIFARKLRRREMTPLDWQAFTGAAQELGRLPLIFADRTSQTLLSVHGLARAVRTRLAAKGQRLGLIVIDHLGILKPSAESVRKSNREQQVAELSRGLRYLAEEYDVHVMALAQIGREAERSKNSVGGIPHLHHLRESDAIGQDADVVLILHRERDAKSGLFVNEKPPALMVAKARSDDTAAMLLGFEPGFVRFGNFKGDEQFGDFY